MSPTPKSSNLKNNNNTIKKQQKKWHILKEDNPKQEPLREELTIRLLLLHLPFALTVENSMSTTLYAPLAATTEARLLSRRK